MPKVYIGQFGAFWRLTLDEWKALCRAAQEPDWTGYNLAAYRELRTKPKWLRKSDSQPGYWPIRNDLVYGGTDRYVEPIDWSPEEFADELQRLDEL